MAQRRHIIGTKNKTINFWTDPGNVIDHIIWVRYGFDEGWSWKTLKQHPVPYHVPDIESRKKRKEISTTCSALW